MASQAYTYTYQPCGVSQIFLYYSEKGLTTITCQTVQHWSLYVRIRMLFLVIWPSLTSLYLQVVSLCQEAALCAMHEDITCSHVALRHFSQAFESVQPQTDQTTIDFYEKYNTK